MIRTRPLGDTGRDVSEVGFGAWAIGGLGYGDVSEDDALAALQAYFEGGGRAVDTARGYGISEILVGKALRRAGLADEVFVASKSGSRLPAIIRTDCETSLFCLQREPVDLYYVHVPPADPDALSPMLDAYQDLKRRGRIRLVGVSQARGGERESVEETRLYLSDPRVDAVQLTYSIARQANRPLFEEARAAGKGMVLRTVLEGGLLTGKYVPGHVWTDSRNDWRAGRDRDRMDALLSKVQEMEALVRPPYENLAQMAIGFALAAPVSQVLVGAKRPSHVRDALAATAAGSMDPALEAELTALGEDLAPLLRRT